MLRLQKLIRVICICAAVVASPTYAASQTAAENSPQTPEQVRLKLKDGSYLVVDDAWETPQGFWYRQGSLNHLLPKDRVKSIERGEPAQKQTKEAPVRDDGPLLMRPVEQVPQPAASQQSGEFDRPVWIYLVGGARVEADSASQSSSGVWYKRGSMSMFLDRTRVDRIELEDVAIAGDSKKERGWSTGSARLDSLIRQNGLRYGVDPYLIFLVMEQESHFNSRVVSPKGARGLMQLMPGTGARYGVRRPFDPAQNISGGTRYLRELLNRFNNRVDLVLASYNAGEGAVIKFGHKVPPYRETRNYVKQISYRYRRNGPKPKAQAARGNSTSTGDK